eukprot:TRINITY_DN173_c1_g1_i1.p1 TRINITY_DN173_c1_g1~~TRINITY_DN173_c1_g1_i1.p1  ORF type:complete len:809 (-),score=197.42 TRINITY_DN173_c1_g1_i1:29-2095(-)
MAQLMRQRQQIDANLWKEYEAKLTDEHLLNPNVLQGGSNFADVDSKAVTECSSKKPAAPGKSGTGSSAGKAAATARTAQATAQSRKGAQWKLMLESGLLAREQRISDAEVAGCFGATGDGRATPWPKGARLLQACFWNGCTRSYTGPDLHIYSYNALEQEVPGAEHHALADIVTNHFERFNFLDGVRDRNKMSAVPNLLAQHLAYWCNLELVSGDFYFFRDKRAQLWLVEAKNLFLLPNVNRANGQGKGGAASEALPQKLFRYLSEEALQSLPVPGNAGDKCQAMLERMISDYQAMKQSYGVENMLRKEHEEMNMNIPVLEGTDFEALAKTFELTGSAKTDGRGKSGNCRRRRYHVETPKQKVMLGHGRWITQEAAKQVEKKASQPSRHGVKMAALIAQGRKNRKEADAEKEQQEEEEAFNEAVAAGASFNTLAARVMGAMKKRDKESTPPASPAPEMETSPISSRTPTKNTLRMVKTFSRSTTRQLTKRGDSNSTTQVPPQKIEIVSTANAELLLLGAGTGICPEGPTLDLYVREGHIARNPGQGLTQCRKASAPSARAVVPPAGAAAAAFVRLSARAREEQAERAEKANAQERASRKTAMLSQASPLQKRAGATALVLPSASFENGSAPEPSQSERSIPSLMLRSTSANSDAEVGNKTPVRTPGPDGPRGHKSLDGFMAFDLNDIK